MCHLVLVQFCCVWHALGQLRYSIQACPTWSSVSGHYMVQLYFEYLAERKVRYSIKRKSGEWTDKDSRWIKTRWRTLAKMLAQFDLPDLTMVLHLPVMSRVVNSYEIHSHSHHSIPWSAPYFTSLTPGLLITAVTCACSCQAPTSKSPCF